MLLQLQQQVALQQQQIAAVAQQQTPATPSGVSSSLPKIRPPVVFHGEIGPAIDRFLLEQQQQQVWYGSRLGTDEARINFAVSHFDGPALQWWHALPREVKSTIVTWADFERQVHSRFRPVQAAMIARQKLDKLRQGKQQSVNSYVGIFLSTLTPITDMSQADQVHHFVNGLHQTIAQKVWERQPKSLQEAIELGVSAEGMFNYGRVAAATGTGSSNPSYGSSFRGSAGQQSSSTSTPMEIGQNLINMITAAVAGNGNTGDGENGTAAAGEPSAAMQLLATRLGESITAMSAGGGRRSNHVPNRTREQIESLRAEGRCFNCKQKGHMKRDCTQPLNH